VGDNPRPRESERSGLGPALRALRQAGGISQEGWAARLGVGRRTVVRWEQGETAPDAAMEEVIVAACQDLGLFQRATRGPLRGRSLTPELLRDLIAEARLGNTRPEPRGPVAEDSPVSTATDGNLPAPLTSFVGREAEQAEVAHLLDTARLITLTGSGGCGKTRLAIEVARQTEERYPGGAWLVELAAVADPSAVVATAAAVFGIKEEAGHRTEDDLIAALRPLRLVLVLDNCEHLIDACADLASTLLRACPRLTILATSRTALRMLGETVWRVPSLAAPDPVHMPAIDRLRNLAAVRLFAERAGSVRPGFAVTEANAAAVAQICHRLDGIPLAIELAAARVTALTPEQIAARLDDRFSLLTAGNRAALRRHQTLGALVDWSYSLLTTDEQRLFASLSVFTGGFTLEAVEAVGGRRGAGSGERGGDGLIPAPSTLDLLGSLINHSLVIAEEADGSMRYRLLETLREYAQARLGEQGSQVQVRDRHLGYYQSLAEQAEPALRGPEQARWIARLAEEHDNLRAALRWCLEGQGGAEAGLRLATTLWQFWAVRGYIAEGRARLEQALALGRGAPPGSRSRALNALGVLATVQGDRVAARRAYEEGLALARAAGDRVVIANVLTNLGTMQVDDEGEVARALLEEALTLYRALRDRPRMSRLLHNLGYLAERQGDHARAWRRYTQSLRLRRALGDAQGVATGLNNLGSLAVQQGDLARARPVLEESLTIRRHLGDEHGAVLTLHSLGELARVQGDLVQARAYYVEAVQIAARLVMRRQIADCLEGLAAIALAHGDAERAARTLGTLEALHASSAGARLPAERAATEGLVASARNRLGAAGYAVEHARGRAMALDDAIALAVQDQFSPR
jgi:predicted ATPase/transcriptional regulator with XRE-family HTH domain/Tfp pilus assembly protein PilF